MWWDWLLLGLAVVMVLVGFVGTVLPALPGPLLVLGGLCLAAWTEDFLYVGAWPLAGIAVLAGLTFVVDFGATALGAGKLGASRRAMIGAALGALAGLFFGIPGILLGPFVGAVIGELTEHRNLPQAGRAGIGAWLGFLLGSVGKLVLVMCMIGIYAGSRFL